MFKRVLQGRLPGKSFFLFGPRQVGKSTLLSDVERLFYLDLLNPKDQLLYSKDPSHLLRVLESLPPKGTIIIDEIQKVPALLDVIHQTMNKEKNLRFILSGSSARKLRKGAANLLGGRAAYRTMHPLTSEELGGSFRWDWVLAFGSLPPITTLLLENDSAAVADLLEGYVITYLREEVKAEALVRNLQGFQNFLDVAAASFAEQVNFLDVSRQCQVGYATVREYYAILEDTLLGFFLYPYLKSVRKRLSHQPKFYFFDNGVTRALLGSVSGPLSPLEKGRLFEQWCLQEIMRFEAYYKKGWKFFFWRTDDGAEVDLLIEERGQIKYAVEFKAKEKVSPADVRGLNSFLTSHSVKKAFVVSLVNQPYCLGDLEVLTLRQLLDKIGSVGR